MHRRIRWNLIGGAIVGVKKKWATNNSRAAAPSTDAYDIIETVRPWERIFLDHWGYCIGYGEK